MVEFRQGSRPAAVSRRGLLIGAAAKTPKLAWNTGAVCGAPIAVALVKAVFEAQDYTVHHPGEAAKAYQPYSPKTSIEDLVAQLRSQTHHHHPVSADLKKELDSYADELKGIQVFKPNFDTAKFADEIYADVVA